MCYANLYTYTCMCYANFRLATFDDFLCQRGSMFDTCVEHSENWHIVKYCFDMNLESALCRRFGVRIRTVLCRHDLSQRNQVLISTLPSDFIYVLR